MTRLLLSLAMVGATAQAVAAQTVRNPPAWTATIGGGAITTYNEDDALEISGTMGAHMTIRQVSGNRGYTVGAFASPFFDGDLYGGGATFILGKRYNAPQSTLLSSYTVGNTQYSTHLIEYGKVYRGIWGLEVGANAYYGGDNFSPQATLGFALLGQHTFKMYGLYDFGAMRPGGGFQMGYFIGPFVFDIHLDMVGGNWGDAAAGMLAWMGIGAAENRF